jgi:hypothetical protein
MKWSAVKTMVSFLLVGASVGLASDDIVRLDLQAKDIEAVVALTDDAADLKLTPAAASELKAVTRDNVGRALMVSIEGIPTSAATIQGMIGSGFVHVAAPSPALRKRLREIQAATSKVGERHAGYARLDINARDIEAVRLNGDTAYLTLTAAGTSKLKTFRRNNVDKVTTVSIEGSPVLATTLIEWSDGRIRIHAPSPALRKRLHAIQEGRATTSDHAPK